MKKAKGIVKGAPSGFLISLMVHAAAFMLAGMLVVFNVVNKEEKKFVPPKPVDRPKMKLKKPKVKVKKSAKPKSTNRIVTKVKRASMPDIQLPEMSGVTAGLAGDVGGFDIMPDLDEVTMFGSGQTIGNDFVGTFYDFNRDRSGKPVIMDPDKHRQLMKEFVRNGWKTSMFSRFSRSPKKLYTTCFAVPTVQSTLAPSAFGEFDTPGYCWAAHYKGQLVYPEDITFRFWGQGDDYLIVKVGGELVLSACWPETAEPLFTPLWSSSSADNRKYPLGGNYSVVGDWITLKAGEPLDMEVLIGEAPGGLFCSLLVVEVQGEEYERNPYRGGPRLPIFKTEELSLDLAEQIQFMLDPGDAAVTNGPVFRDYISKQNAMPKTDALPEPQMPEDPVDSFRLWSSADGRTMEAEYVAVMGDQVVLKTRKGRQKKLPLSILSEADRAFVELENPPKFDLNFAKTSKQIQPPPTSPFLDQQPRPMRIFDYTFGVKMHPRGRFEYDHELTVEYFAIANQVDGNNYILLEHQESRFTPGEENQGSHSFSGDPVRVVSSALRFDNPMRGAEYGGYLILVTDERGRIIGYSTSHDWLYEIREQLRKIPAGRNFDTNGNRVGPTRPTEADRPEWIFG